MFVLTRKAVPPTLRLHFRASTSVVLEHCRPFHRMPVFFAPAQSPRAPLPASSRPFYRGSISYKGGLQCVLPRALSHGPIPSRTSLQPHLLTSRELPPSSPPFEDLIPAASVQQQAFIPRNQASSFPVEDLLVEDRGISTVLHPAIDQGLSHSPLADVAVVAMDALEMLMSLAVISFAGISTAAFAFAVFVTVGVLFQPRWIISFVRKRLPHIVFEYVTREKLIALTIDDSPNGESTSEILDILKEYRCKATFFVIGSNVDKYPDLVERMHLEGHEIGNHTMDDVPSWRMPLDTLEMSLLEVDSKLQRFFRTDETGKALKWFRPGHGWSTKPMRQLVESHGYRLALGSVFPVDPLFKESGGPLASYCLWKIYPGAILILHDRPQQAKQTKEILTRILPVLREQGYQLVTLSEIAKHADMSGKDPETVSLL